MKKGWTVLALLLLASAGFAQQVVIAQRAQGESDNNVFMMERFPAPPGAEADFMFMTMARGDEQITGAPYTATAVTETTQTLGDGNRIVHKSTATLARDSQGRTRREETIEKIGALPVESPRLVIIRDPVAKLTYLVAPEKNTARAIKTPGDRAPVVAERMERTEKMRVKIAGSERGPEWISKEAGDVKQESLGTQTIEGVSCEGQRETRTIPAGAIGNERPIVITSETWTSPDLHALVLRKRNDPRFGETTYRLTDIRRGEPDASLFQPPAGAKIITTEERRRPI